MFSFREFIKRGFLNAVGKLPDYRIILNAAGWYDKDVLLEEDLAEIQSAIEARNAAQIPGVAPTGATSPQETDAAPTGATPPQETDAAPTGATPPQETDAAPTDETPPQETDAAPTDETPPQGADAGETPPQETDETLSGESASA
jgi:hypothetical protein